jgi:HmuY protein
MNPTLKVFTILLFATLAFHTTLNFMLDNIEDYETVPLPPKPINKNIIKASTNPTLTIKAQSKESWTLVSFASGKMHTVEDLDKQREELSRLDWDLAFQRTKIFTNSGITNPKGKVGVINLGLVDFDSIQSVPESEFIQDSKSFGRRTNKAFTGWYNYRTRTHNIESKKNVYVVKTSTEDFLKMRILNYYCSNDEKDCRTQMCSRSEAACLTVEYISSNHSRTFPPPPAPSPEVSMKIEPTSTEN